VFASFLAHGTPTFNKWFLRSHQIISPYGKEVENSTRPQQMQILYVNPYVILIKINEFTFAPSAVETC
jgi:hypothetical protein